MLGDILDNRYRIIRTLSKGGFGQTYIAEDTRRPGCPRCVMKHLKPLVLDPTHLSNARRLFQTEAIALEKLGHHPQIPRLLAYFEENNDFYLVQDLIRGYPLTKELKIGFQWLEADIYQLLYDVLSILIFVHDRGVIHRDIKPDNIIRHQLDRTLVLVDFGSVKQIRTHLHPNHETGQTISIGTIGYMSTEQAHGRPRPNSDLYSLGIIGIQAATGIKPKNFQEDGATGELVWRHQANISDGLACFLEKMVAYHFKDRYLDARAALRALKQIQPHGSPRYGLKSDESLLDKPSYWSLTASRLASAITSLRPALPNTPLAQPTFIELPEPTEVSKSGSERGEPVPPLEEVNQTIPMAYVAPLVNPGADMTTADFDGNTDGNADGNVVMASSSSAGHEFARHESEESNAEYEQDIADVPGISEQTSKHQGDDSVFDPLESQDGAMYGPRLAAEGVDNHSELLAPLTIVKPTFLNGVVRLGDRWGNRISVLSRQTHEQRFRALFWFCGGVGAIALTFWGGQLGYQRVQASRQVQATLQLVQDHQNRGRYTNCQEQAQQFKGKSEELDSLGYQCILQDAEQMFKSGEWKTAIATANEIPVEAGAHYETAQLLIHKWPILALEMAVHDGNLDRVLDIADAIVPNHPLQAEVQLARLKGQMEKQVWLEGFALHEQGQWEEASERVQPLEESPYFHDLAQGLRKEADLNLKPVASEDGDSSSRVSNSSSGATPLSPTTVQKNKTKP